MKIEDVRKKYPDQWVLVEVTKIDRRGNIIEGTVIANSKNRDDTYRKMKETKAKDIAHFYTGEIPQKGYAVAYVYRR